MRRASGSRAAFVLLAAGAAVLYLGGLGHFRLFARDEALYAEAGREMLASGDWITPRVNGGPFFEKPPLYYWLAAASYWALGVSPFAARLPGALMAIATVLMTAAIGSRVWGLRAGMLAGVSLATCLQVIVIGRMGIMDVPIMFLTTAALLVYARWRHRGGLGSAAAFGVLVALGVLTKALAGALAPLIAAIHMAAHRGRGRPPWLASALIAVAAFAVVAAPWFIAMGIRHGGEYGSTLFIREHLVRMAQPMQGHGGPIYTYMGLILLSFFPWIVFTVPAMASRRLAAGDAQAFWHSLAIVWIAAVLIPFSLVRTKLPGYVTPLFPALALLAGAELDRRLRERGRAPWVAVIAGAALLGAFVLILPSVAARVGERVGASADARRLVAPVAVWAAGYGIMAAAGIMSLGRASQFSVTALGAGQVVVVGAALIGVLPIVSPYVGGGAAELAEVAARELRGSQVVLYDTRPETVAFVLQRSVPSFGRDQQDAVRRLLARGDTALLAPAQAREFLGELPARRSWRAGDRVLLDIPKLPSG